MGYDLRMDSHELKQVVAKHFDYAQPGTGQFFHGDWFTPKHKDSLSDLLDEFCSGWQHEADAGIVKELEDAKKEIEELEDKIRSAENALA